MKFSLKIALGFLLVFSPSCGDPPPLPPVQDPPEPCYVFDFKLGVQPGVHKDSRCTDGDFDDVTQAAAIEREKLLAEKALAVTSEEIANSARQSSKYIQSIFEPYVNGPEQQKVKEILARIQPHTIRTDIRYRITVVRSPKRPVYNAMVTPSGDIYITKSLYDFAMGIRESALVAVICHEIGHVENLHGDYRIAQEKWLDESFSTQVQSIFDGIFGSLTLCMTRHNETVADKAALYLMEAAGYNPEGSLELYKAFQRLLDSPKEASLLKQMTSSHPLDQTRFDCVANYYYESRTRVHDCGGHTTDSIPAR